MGGCYVCLGPGKFMTAKRQGGILSAVVRGRLSLSEKTRLAIGYIRGRGIGRFRLYRVRIHPKLDLVPTDQGCLAAGTVSLGNGRTSGSLLNDLLNPKSLPEVPCGAKIPKTDGGILHTPYELSSSTDQIGRVTGSASEKRWLSIFRAHRACAVNALAEVSRATSFQVFPVKGDFSQDFKSGTDTQPGFYCAYLQTGGRFHGVPTGRLTASWKQTFLAGDTVSIPGPSVAIGGQAIPTSVTGVTSTTEQLWEFVSHQPCAATAQEEYPLQVQGTTAPVKGAFTIPVSTGPFTSSVYICAYLQLGAPLKSGLPAGPTLARAAQPVSLATGSVGFGGNTSLIQGDAATGNFSGTTSLAEQLWIFATYGSCAASAQAEYAEAFNVVTYAVNGNFSETVVTEPLSGPANWCAYLQLGAPADGQPTGLVVASTAAPIAVATGSIVITGDLTVNRGSTWSGAVTGTAGTKEQLWVFTSYNACSPDAQSEELTADVSRATLSEVGGFSYSTQSLALNFTGQAYECAYLQLGDPTPDGSPTGRVVATYFGVFTVQ